jgi:UPF0755 protein
MFQRIAAGCVLVLLLLGTGGAVAIALAGSPSDAALAAIDHFYGDPVSSDPRPVHFVIQPGDSATAIGDRLSQSGLIRNSLAFRLSVRLDGVQSDLEAGDYQLQPSMPLPEIISRLAQGRVSGGLVTIPEGWRASEIAGALERANVTSGADFLKLVGQAPASAVAPLGDAAPGSSLEGYLFPDSYRFTPNTTPSDVLQRMTGDFASHLSPELKVGFQASGLTLPQAVTLASIVEREAYNANERPVIASVYLNRLHRGMKLQADPTVQFALAPDSTTTPPFAEGFWKRRLTTADLGVESPYNTYVSDGLPPGPICNPGLASLEAVAHPATTDFLYFVARPDGSHAFARTLAEHEQNVQRYQS